MWEVSTDTSPGWKDQKNCAYLELGLGNIMRTFKIQKECHVDDGENLGGLLLVLFTLQESI